MVVTILNGDALSLLRTLDSESVQMCATSPPYYRLRDYGVTGQIGMEHTPSEFIADLVAVFTEVRRVLRSDGVCFVNLGDSYAGSGKGPTGHNGIGNQSQRQGFTGKNAGFNERWGNSPGKRKQEISQAVVRRPAVDGIPPKNLLLIPQRFAIAMQDAGWIVRSEIVWAKTSAMPESVKDRPTSAWEPIWMFSKSGTYFWDYEAVRRQDTPGTHGSKRVGGLDQLTGLDRGGTSQDGLPRMAVGQTGANLRNVWLLGPEPSRLEHYAGFPTELPRRCIKAASRPGDTVLDPFLGTGTTALVADQLGRHAIGIELNPVYAEMARKRINDDAPMVSAPVDLSQPAQIPLLEAM